MKYIGNTGGVAFGYNMPENITKPTLYVLNSVFHNNSVIAISSFHTSSQTVASKVFTGRGGAMAVYSNASHHSMSVFIIDCIYESNSAWSYGGGLYHAIVEKINTGYYPIDITIEGTTFACNTAGFGGGGAALFSF